MEQLLWVPVPPHAKAIDGTRLPFRSPRLFSRKENTMLRWALLFLIIALIAGALGVYPVAAISSEIAWVFFVIFVVLFLVSLVTGGIRSGPPV